MRAEDPQLPAILAHASNTTKEKIAEFFFANIRNPNTRRAYQRQVKQFLVWYDERFGLTDLNEIRPLHVAAYIEEETKQHEAQTVKQQLAAIRMLFDWLVVRQEIPMNPASAVRGPRYSVKKGKTPVLSRAEAKFLLDSIQVATTSENGTVGAPLVVGLRDRALIALMVYTFARVGAVLKMEVRDYYPSGGNGEHWLVRLKEKSGKDHEVPVHHTAGEYLDAYLDASGIREEPQSPLFRTTRGRSGRLTERGLQEREALAMIKRRATAAGMQVPGICCHTFRATGITAYLENGGTVENAQQIAAHESPMTTKRYDRRSDSISPGEIERIQL
mgnify:FL=1|jgi:Site-specific recombinase XerD